MSSLLPDIQRCLPDGRIPVLALLTISLPEVVTANRIMQPEKYVSSLPPNSEDIDKMLTLPIPPPDIVNALQHLIRKPEQSDMSVFCPHVPTAGGKCFPTMIVLCWARLLEICGVQSKWKEAVDKLQKRMVQEPESVLGLESKIETHILSAFFTTEWLSDDHKQLMLELLKIDLQKAGQHDILVEHTAIILLLTAAYADRQNYASDWHYAWLRMHGEDLAAG
ncbi:hypothetical protein BDZ97DRAFT_1927882 [Flammula alnicola]|nr:hypothetical protein BDZ97DRAFT_1927882 [Flammula alnicola]